MTITADTKMKEFLSNNNIPFNNGKVYEDFDVSYFVGKNLKFNETMKVLFDFIHTDFRTNISLLDNDLDSEKFYTAFSPDFQNYSFDEEENSFIIEHTAPNKHGKPYKVIIKPLV